MTNLDKMARELLAAEYGRDRPRSEVAQKLRGHKVGQLRTADTVALSAVRAALLTAPPGWQLVPVDERQWTDEMRDAGRAAVMAAQCATATWTPRRHFEAAGRNTDGIPEDVLDERGPLTKESIAVMVMGAMIAAAPEPKP